MAVIAVLTSAPALPVILKRTAGEMPAVPPAAPVGAPVVAGSGNTTVAPDGHSVGVGVVLLVLGAVVAATNVLPSFSFEPAPGVSVFAVFYVLAQTLERVAELVSLLWPGAGAATPGGIKPAVSKRIAVRDRDKALAAALSAPVPEAVTAAAVAQELVERVRLNRAVLAWTFNSALAMVAARVLGARLLHVLSATTTVPAWLDVVITGLVVGTGTKPLHDLIAHVQEARKARQDPAPAGR